MTNKERPTRPVFGLPPVDGSDEELDAWVGSFLDAVMANAGEPEDGDPRHIAPYGGSDEPDAELDPRLADWEGVKSTHDPQLPEYDEPGRQADT